jgi:hypothetical protein
VVRIFLLVIKIKRRRSVHVTHNDAKAPTLRKFCIPLIVGALKNCPTCALKSQEKPCGATKRIFVSCHAAATVGAAMKFYTCTAALAMPFTSNVGPVIGPCAAVNFNINCRP